MTHFDDIPFERANSVGYSMTMTDTETKPTGRDQSAGHRVIR